MRLLAEREARAAGLEPIPGDPGPPILNQNLALLRGTAFTDLSFHERFGGVYWSRALGLNQVSAVSPEAVGAVLTNRDKAFANGPAWSFFIGPFFDRGLMLLDFSEHHRHRLILQQAFTRQRLVGYLDQMTPTITEHVARLSHQSPVLFYPAIKALGLTIAMQTFMGDRAGVDDGPVMDAFGDCVQAGLAILRRPVPGLRWHKGLRGRALLEAYLEPRVTEARNRDGDDLLWALCHSEGEDGQRFTDRDIVNHMIFLIMAAHDTSTSTMTAMAYFLAKHPGWQQRCREESLALGRSMLEYDDVDRLTGLDLVMKESMRLQPPVPGLARMAVKDADLAGFFVPKGTMVGVSVSQLHRLPSTWTEPLSFDPDRFDDPRREDQVHRFAYAPFGGGVHKCLGMAFAGMEIKSVLHRLLLEYEWTMPEGYQMPVSWKSLPYPKDGLPLTLRRRRAE